MNKTVPQLSNLIDQTALESVHAEILRLAEETAPNFNGELFCRHFNTVQSLYEGKFEGYKACNTPYHDFGHTVDVTLASARIIHGAIQSGISFDSDDVLLLLVASLLHDSGYIQKTGDNLGTGAKYTKEHVVRSIEFAEKYCEIMNCAGMFPDVRILIVTTEFMQDPDKLVFNRKQTRILANILGTADLLGQMANRCYLEKLLHLYGEFREGNVAGYDTERDMLSKTTTFYSIVLKRLDKELCGVYKYLDNHFKQRWGIEKDLYHETVKSNMLYLDAVIREKDYRQLLRRGGIVKCLMEQESRGEKR